MPIPRGTGWETPYGRLRGGPSRATRPAAPLGFTRPEGTANRWQYPGYYPSPAQIPRTALEWGWGQGAPIVPPEMVSGGPAPISATMPLGARTAPIGAPWTIPGGAPIPAPAATPGGVGPGMEYAATALGALAAPGQVPGQPAAIGPWSQYQGAIFGPGEIMYPVPGGMGMYGAGAPPIEQAPPGVGQAAPTGAGAGAPAPTGAFGPFGSIEDWRNQFYAEHGRWPNDADARDAIASFGFLGAAGRGPTQQEWEQRYYGGYGGTTQWGPMGGGRGGWGGGGWAAPAQPSWWGGNVLGEEGWAYLPTEPGQYPSPVPERGEQTGAPWYNIKEMKAFQEVPPQYRDWVQQVMQSQQSFWEDPLMAPVQWMTPAWSEL